LKDLVDEETQELLAATSGGKGEKAMTAEELKKAASAHLKKAMEMVKSHVAHKEAVHKAHFDNVAALHKAHAAAMDGCPNVAACKGLAKAHGNHMDGVHKAHLDHTMALNKAFSDGMDAHLQKADSPDAPNILSAAAVGGEPGNIDLTAAGTKQVPTPGDNYSAKGVSAADLKKLLDDQKAELTKAFEEKNDQTLELLAKALIGLQADPDPQGGVGDRALVVNKGTVRQTQPVTKADDVANDGRPKVITGEVVTQDDVAKALGGGDQNALLKLARGITSASNVPAHLSGTPLFKNR
jgi:hypothetical protein